MERRQEERTSITDVIHVEDDVDHERLGTLIDISPKGLRIRGPEPSPLNEDLNLCLRLPSQILGKRTIRVTAVCVWSQKEPESELWQSGFEFYHLSQLDSSLVIGLIIETLKASDSRGV